LAIAGTYVGGEVLVELVDLPPEAEYELLLELVDMFPRLHVLLRERLLPQVHAQSLRQADSVGIVELVHRARVGA